MLSQIQDKDPKSVEENEVSGINALSSTPSRSIETSSISSLIAVDWLRIVDSVCLFVLSLSLSLSSNAFYFSCISGFL